MCLHNWYGKYLCILLSILLNNAHYKIHCRCHYKFQNISPSIPQNKNNVRIPLGPNSSHSK